MSFKEAEYLARNFISDKEVVLNQSIACTLKSKVYDEFVAYCESNGVEPSNSNTFWRVMNSIYKGKIKNFKVMNDNTRVMWTNLSFGSKVELPRDVLEYGMEKTWFNVIVTKEMKQKMSEMKIDGFNWQANLREHIAHVIGNVGK